MPAKRMFRKSGPDHAIRPFQPTMDLDNSLLAEEKILDALEHIAVALSAIDHNLETLVRYLTQPTGRR